MKRSDTALRGQATPGVINLLEAYEAVTKRRITLDHIRMRALGEIDRRGYVADDIALVVKYVRRLARLPKTHGMRHGFSDASIGFQNLLLDVNKFEDRVMEAREQIARVRDTNGKLVREPMDAGDGVVTLTERADERAPVEIRTALASALSELAQKVAG